MSTAPEIMAALGTHTQSVQQAINQLVAQLGEERALREEIERKLNRLMVRNTEAANDDEGPDPQEALVKTLRTNFPARDPSRVDAREYRAAVRNYLRAGAHGLSPEEAKAMSVGIDTDGGITVDSTLERRVRSVERNNSVVRSVASVISIGTGSIDLPITLSGAGFAWVGEISSRPNTAAPTLGKTTVVAEEGYACVPVTQTLLDDSSVDIDAYITDQIGLTFAEKEDDAFLNGNGVSKPRGLFTYPTAATSDAAGTRPFGTIEHVASGVSGGLPTNDYDALDKLIDLTMALKPGYRRNAQWLMPTAMVAKLRKLKDSNKQSYWSPSAVAGQPSTFLGYNIIEAEQAPAPAAGSLSIAFGDFKRGYVIADRIGVRVIRDNLTQKPYVLFYVHKRVGGALTDSLAVKMLKLS